MKRIVGFLLVLVMIFTVFTTNITASKSLPIKRYTVLVLDTSGAASFRNGSGQIIYTADSAINYVKQAANKFVDDLLTASGSNYVAIVSYKETAETIINFTNDEDLLKQKINSLFSSSETRDISAGLDVANALISMADPEAIKNVVLVTTGMSNDGDHSYSGHYNESTIGGVWHRTDTKINLYAYANVAYSSANAIKAKANLYTLGIFQTMNGMPEEGKEIAQFFKLTAADLASSKDHFYDIDNPENIEFVFGEIVDDITLHDTDGDGLYDDWETNGIDFNDDGIIDLHLEQMGADPRIPDIFVEVDWMVQPQIKVSFIETQPELSLAPSQESMRIVYNSFKQHGINLHIDVGPESIDFVTGKRWGTLSGGNQIPYEENFEIGSDASHWNDVVASNFDVKNRGNVFRHCMFINTYNGGTSSGLAAGIPGQYFIIANQNWLRQTGNLGIAGTFMHELGHTLGLSHGGYDANNENNHTNYKPNYLSIMNYLFQTSGLVGTNEINYSDYSLPELNESALIESNGIDPYGLTAGTGLGTKILVDPYYRTEMEITPISRITIDYNNISGIDSSPVTVDLNKDGINEVLTGNNDWEHIIYAAGDIGSKGQIIHIAGIDRFTSEEKTALTEVTLEERLKNGLLANEGAGYVEAIGPFTLFEGYSNQGTYLRVSNLTPDDTTFTLTVEGNNFVDNFTKQVTVKGSTDKINYEDIRIPVKDNPKSGDYAMKAILKNTSGSEEVFELKFNVYAPTEDELKELEALLQNKDPKLPEHMLNEYETILSNQSSLIKSFLNNKALIIAIATVIILLLLTIIIFIIIFFIKSKKKKSATVKTNNNFAGSSWDSSTTFDNTSNMSSNGNWNNVSDTSQPKQNESDNLQSSFDVNKDKKYPDNTDYLNNKNDD